MEIFNLLAQAQEPEIIQIEIAFAFGLLLTTVVAVIARRTRFPYTVALVLVGLGLSVMRFVAEPGEFITGEHILQILVPPLVFEGALRVNWRNLRQNLVAILLMAVVGVSLSTFVVGGVILGIDASLERIAELFSLTVPYDLIELSPIAAMAFGALISATDPVAVISFFRTLGVNKRLSMLVEGESLFNDGTSIVIFRLAVGLGSAATIVVGTGGNPGINIGNLAIDFLTVALGGVLTGLVVGYIAHILFIRYLDDRLVETTSTILVAFGAFALAEYFHLSGILSVVAAGIYIGNQIPVYTTPTTKNSLHNFWEIIAFIATSLIFLIIGWEIDVTEFLSIQTLVLILSAVVAILVSRFLVVYGISYVSGWLGPNIPRPYQHVMFWGGLRGAISLALALSLDQGVFGPAVDNQLKLMTFGVVLFTLLVQGTTIEGLIKRLGLARKTKRQMEKEKNFGGLFAARAAQQELERLHAEGVVSGTIWEAMLEAHQADLDQHDQVVRDMLHQYPNMEGEIAVQVRRAMIFAERTALGEALRQEIISENVYEQMMDDTGERLEVLEAIEAYNTTATVSIEHEKKPEVSE